MPYLVNGRIPKAAKRGMRKSAAVGVRGRSALSVAQKALRAVRNIKAREERKFYQSGTGLVSGLTTVTNGYILHLPQVAVGTGAGDRTGNSITVKRIQIKGKLMTNELSNMTWRVMVVRDRQQIQATTPAVSDVLVSARTYAMTRDDTTRPARFEILSDKTVVQQASYLAQDMTSFYTCDLKTDIEYNYATGYGYDQNKNGLYLVVCLDYSGASGANASFSTSTEAAFDLNYLITYTDS